MLVLIVELGDNLMFGVGLIKEHAQWPNFLFGMVGTGQSALLP